MTFPCKKDMEADDPLDFELEDLFIPQSVLRAPPKKKGTIGLDDLLKDYYQEKIKVDERKSKKSRMQSADSSDDEDDNGGKKKEDELYNFVSECERQVNTLSPLVNVAPWGQRIFGCQKSPSKILFPALDACPLLQQLSENNELKSMAGLSIQNGEDFMVELLVGGWLLTLVLSRGHCDEFTMRWTFNLMAHSSNENIAMSACKFLCSIIISGIEAASRDCAIGWLPTYFQLKEVIEIYGYMEDSMGNEQISSEREHNDELELDGPPGNICSWLKFVSTYCRRRSRSLISIYEAESLAVMVLRLFLDRQLYSISSLLQESLGSILNFFTEEEWHVSLKRISASLCHSLPGKDFNCVRLAESLSGVDARIKELQRDAALGMLLNCMGKQECMDAKEIVDLLTSTNIRDKQTDFVQLFIHLVLADVWLWGNPLINENPVILVTWLHFLRGCSCQISSTDWRAYASKVRNKASYLIQIYEGQR